MVLPVAVGAVMVTSPKRGGALSQEVRQALAAPTREGQVEALLQIVIGDDLPSAMEAGDALAAIGPPAVARLVSQMRRAKNNWLIGGILSRMGPEAVAPLVELLAGADEATAVDCIYLLGELQEQGAVGPLIDQLSDKRERVRMFAVSALVEIGGDRAVEAVLQRLAGEERGLVGFIEESLVRHAKSAFEPVLRGASHTEARVRTEVAYLLGRLGEPKAVEPLLQLVGDPVASVRRNAALSLGRLGSVVAQPERVLRRLAGLLADGDEGVGEAAREALVSYASRALPVLRDVCRTGGEREVVAGLNALREIGSPEGEETMVSLLLHPKRTVKVAAVAGLMAVGTSNSLDPLLRALRDEDLRWFASLALERLGSSRPDLFLAARADDPHLALRAEILVKLGAPVVPFLVRYLQDAEAARRALALWALGEISDPAAAEGVAELLDDPVLGAMAGRTLRKFGDRGFSQLVRYAAVPRSEAGALQTVEALALFEGAPAVRELEQCVCRPLPHKARVRAAVKLLALGDAEAAGRIKSYLDAEGQSLRGEVAQAVRDEGRTY